MTFGQRQMSEHERQSVAALLSRVTAAGVSMPRAQRYHAIPDAIRFFADAIQTTVLKRILHFSLDGGPLLAVLVSGGRLLRVIEASPQHFGPPATYGFTEKDATLFCAHLERSLSGGHEISVTARKPTADMDAPFQGMSGGTLLHHFELIQLHASGLTPLEVFEQSAQDLFLAVWVEGCEPMIYASEFTFSHDLHAWIAQTFDRIARHVTEERLILFPDVASASASIALHFGPDGRRAFVLASGAEPELAHHWAMLPNLALALE